MHHMRPVNIHKDLVMAVQLSGCFKNFELTKITVLDGISNDKANNFFKRSRIKKLRFCASKHIFIVFIGASTIAGKCFHNE